MSTHASACIWLPAHDAAAMQQFYVNELGWFVLAQDWGMGQLELRWLNGPLGLCIHPPPDGCVLNESATPRLSLRTSELDAEFARLNAMSLRSGAALLSPHIFEYPAGRNFMLRDPAGHCVLLEAA